MFISKNLFFYIKRYQEMGWKFLYQNSIFFKSKISFFYIKKSISWYKKIGLIFYIKKLDWYFNNQKSFFFYPEFDFNYNFNCIAFRDIDLEFHIPVYEFLLTNLDVMQVKFSFCHVWHTLSSVIALCKNLVVRTFLSRLLWYWLQICFF